MRRREFIALAAAWPFAAHAQQANRIRRIGLITALSEDRAGAIPFSPLRKRLEELGWSEGRDVAFDTRFTTGQPDLIRKHVAELVAMQPDIIVSTGAPNAVALQQATSTIPVIFIFVSDPLGMGLVKSMARPGGNISGFAAFEPSLGGKWLEMLKEIAPLLTRAAIIYNPNTAPNSPAFIEPAERAGSALGVSVVLRPVHNNAELDAVAAAFGAEPGGGLIQVPDPFLSARAELLATAGIRNRLPLISPFRWIASAGGLISYGIDAVEQSRQAAGYADRILRGEAPGTLPVQQPTTFELVINLKTAKALGLSVPQSLLLSANEVIE